MDKLDAYIFIGNPGTGKTTAAENVAAELDVPVLDPDIMRRELGFADYDPKDTHLIMVEIFRRKMQSLREGIPVVMASPYVELRTRMQSYRLINQMTREISAVMVECVCSKATAKARIKTRGVETNLHQSTNDPSKWDAINAKYDDVTTAEMDANPQFSFLRFDTENLNIKRRKIRQETIEALGELERILLG